MNLAPTSIYVNLGSGKMAAIIRDEETDKYYYQIVAINSSGIEKNQIKIEDCIGPFLDFVSVNNAVDQNQKEIK